MTIPLIPLSHSNDSQARLGEYPRAEELATATTPQIGSIPRASAPHPLTDIRDYVSQLLVESHNIPEGRASQLLEELARDSGFRGALIRKELLSEFLNYEQTFLRNLIVDTPFPATFQTLRRHDSLLSPLFAKELDSATTQHWVTCINKHLYSISFQKTWEAQHAEQIEHVTAVASRLFLYYEDAPILSRSQEREIAAAANSVLKYAANQSQLFTEEPAFARSLLTLASIASLFGVVDNYAVFEQLFDAVHWTYREMLETEAENFTVLGGDHSESDDTEPSVFEDGEIVDDEGDVTYLDSEFISPGSMHWTGNEALFDDEGYTEELDSMDATMEERALEDDCFQSLENLHLALIRILKEDGGADRSFWETIVFESPVFMPGMSYAIQALALSDRDALDAFIPLLVNVFLEDDAAFVALIALLNVEPLVHEKHGYSISERFVTLLSALPNNTYEQLIGHIDDIILPSVDCYEQILDLEILADDIADLLRNFRRDIANCK